MIIENQTFDEERALYGLKGLTVKNCPHLRNAATSMWPTVL